MKTPTITSSLKAAAFAAVLGLSGPLAANAQQAHSPDGAQGLGLMVGYHSHYWRAKLMYETPSLWSYPLQNGWGHLDLHADFGLSVWQSQRRGSKSMGQLGAGLVARWWPGQNVFLELGSGPAVLSRTRFAGHNVSTRFQFESHLGLGVRIGAFQQISVRFTHVSNAGIKKPNPGLDLVEASYRLQF